MMERLSMLKEGGRKPKAIFEGADELTDMQLHRKKHARPEIIEMADWKALIVLAHRGGFCMQAGGLHYFIPPPRPSVDGGRP